jgi:hypothetical protein
MPAHLGVLVTRGLGNAVIVRDDVTHRIPDEPRADALLRTRAATTWQSIVLNGDNGRRRGGEDLSRHSLVNITGARCGSTNNAIERQWRKDAHERCAAVHTMGALLVALSLACTPA